jgi:hypothetical protein
VHSKKIGTFFTAGLTHFFLVLFIQALPLYRQPWELAIILYLLSSRISGRRNEAQIERSPGGRRANPRGAGRSTSTASWIVAGTIAHDEDTISELDGFLDIVRDEEDCFLFALPDAHQIGTHFFIRNRL